MKDIVKLLGRESDKDIIIDTGTDVIYVLDVSESQLQLGNYIQQLHDWGVKNRTLCKLRMSSNIPLDAKVRVEVADAGPQHPQDMAALLALLQPDQTCSITIENDERALLAAVTQQLIYIDYPMTNVNIALAREAKDQMRTERFIQHLNKLFDSAQNAVVRLKNIEQNWQSDASFNDQDRVELKEMHKKNMQGFKEITEQLGKARSHEIKLAVAASKKAGKSTIVNSMIGCELAPTSLERPTPNTCIYRKSPDREYHLIYRGQTTSYPDRATISRALGEEFERARAGTAAEKTIPDMGINYVSNKNNFESYTVFDTPGPNLAGALEQAESAYNAIEECDVALFAIDFTKQLTIDEEKYLRKIKELFDAHGQIHTLVFTANKMDQVFNQTKEANSRIKSIDWIRTRLIDIDPGYANCVIFATSAQDYFNTLELEQLAAEIPAIAPLLAEGVNWCGQTRQVVRNLQDDDAEDDIISLVTNIHTETDNLNMQLDVEHVDIDVMRNFSGMPQLMKYVAYIAQSKARDEILNGITYKVADIISEIGDVSREIQNLRTMMDQSQEEIDRITAVLDEHVSATREILVPGELTAADVKAIILERSPIRDLVQDDVPPISLNDLVKRAVNKIHSDLHHQLYEVANMLWEPFKNAMVETLAQKKLQKLRKDNAVIELSDNRLKEVDDVLKKYVKWLTKKAEGMAEQTTQALQSVLQRRSDDVDSCTKKCKEKLKHEDVSLQFPPSPAFQASLQLPPLSNVTSALQRVPLDKHLSRVTEQLWPIHQFFRNLFLGKDLDTTEVQIKDVGRSKYADILEKAKPSFEDMLKETGVIKKLKKYVDEIAKSVNAALSKIVREFDEVTKKRMQRIESFRDLVDDRDHFRDRLAALERKETVIRKITEATAGFADVWEEIVPAETV